MSRNHSGDDRPIGSDKMIHAGNRDRLVSVVIPCFNHAHFLADALRSVMTQTHKHVEIIVVDDASTDATLEVARTFPEVHYIRHPRNRGLVHTRNTGLANATGRFVVFLDADDFLYPPAVEAGLGCLDNNPQAGFAFGSHSIVSADGTWLRDQPVVIDSDDVYAELLVKNVVGMPAAAMFRKSAVEEAGAFDPRLKACEDYDLMLRVARLYPVAHHRQIVAGYRKHDANMSADFRLMLKTSIRALRKQESHARQDEQLNERYEEGLLCWKMGYGSLLFDRALNNLRTGNRRWRGLTDMLVVARYLGLSQLRRWLADPPKIEQ